MLTKSNLESLGYDVDLTAGTAEKRSELVYWSPQDGPQNRRGAGQVDAGATKSSEASTDGSDGAKGRRNDSRGSGRRISLELPEPPSSNRWHRHVGDRVVKSKAARDYELAVLRVCIAERVYPIRKPAVIGVSIQWYRGRKAGDLDKRVSILLDALQGSAYENDSQIATLMAMRYDDQGPPRVRVEVWEL